jgi:ribosome-associated protein
LIAALRSAGWPPNSGVPEAWDGIGASSLGAGTMRRQQPFGRQAGRAQMWRETISRLQSIPDPDQILELVTSSLDDDKAEDIVAIPLGGKSSMADFMVIASGRSSRQVASMAEHLEFRLKQAGVEVLGLEGMRQADWVLIDANDVIVHLFRPEVREFYGLERMWANDGPQEVVTVSS